MELRLNDLLQTIGRLTMEIELLRDQNTQLQQALNEQKEQPKSNAKKAATTRG